MTTLTSTQAGGETTYATNVVLAGQQAQLWPWTVEQYHHLIDIGILPEGEPYELLDGQLVRKDRSATGADPMTVSTEHAWVVRKLTRLNPTSQTSWPW